MLKLQLRLTLLAKVLTVVGLFAPFGTTSFAQQSCKQVHLQINERPLFGAQFLLQRDQNFHRSPEVSRAASQKIQRPADRVQAWIDYLTQFIAKSQTSPRSLETLKNSIHQMYVIKPEAVPQSYFDFQARLARERGHGDIRITPAQKQTMIDTLIKDQKASIDPWVDYLVSSDTNMYPVWMKYWMFQGMTRLSKFDPETGVFGRRDTGTVAPFAELNREALAKVADLVLKHLNKTSLDQLNDPDVQAAVQSLNFGRIYGQILKQLGVGGTRRFHTNEGQWIKYPKGSDHRPLVQSLDGKNTGWCTAGEATAKKHLDSGDFYVYYSRDRDGQLTDPRVAIRMEGDQIAEVRGVDKSQELDPQISSSNIVSSKMQEFGDRGTEYLKKDADMKMLTEIDRKHQAGSELTVAEIRFLYELDQKIQGFGYNGSDPRIKGILNDRDFKQDLSRVFPQYQPHEISNNRNEVLTRGHSIKLFYGNLILNNLTSARGLVLPHTIYGNLDLSYLTSPRGLILPEIIKGGVDLTSLRSAEGLKFQETLNGDLLLNSLTTTKGLILPKTVNGLLDLGALTSSQGLILPDTINGDLDLRSLTVAQDLRFPETLNGHLDLTGLTSAQGLSLPKTINGHLYLLNLASIDGLILPEVLNGELKLSKNIDRRNITLPRRTKSIY